MGWSLFWGFITGGILGSFVKATADRIAGQNKLRGRSYCISCKRQLNWYDLFPVFSFLSLKGKCRYCQKPIPFANLLTEVILGIIMALFFVSTIPQNWMMLLSPTWPNALFWLELVFKILVIVVLALVFLIDLRKGIIPDKITYPAAAVAAFYLLSSFALKSWIFYQNLFQVPFGEYLLPPYSPYFIDILQRTWMGLFWTVLTASGLSATFILLIILTKGKGMGWGDVKYVLFLGLALGFPNSLLAIFLAFLLGAVFSLALIALRKKSFGQTIPFGPFLSSGALIALVLGGQIINWYLHGF